MKRLGYLGAVLLIAGAAWAGSTITVTPSDMKSGETKTFEDGEQKISISRSGDDVDIRIQGAGGTKSITVQKSNDGSIRIGRGDVLMPGLRSFVVGPERKRIVIDGVPVVPEFEHFRDLPRLQPRKQQTWFVCPKDHTLLAIPDAKENQTYKCPVDGTVLEKKKGRGFSFFFDEDSFESESL
ncbi:MAG TPA: hypothetical protein VGR02_08820 [Thermoanaerobaculia bacterium]|jgi:hypothetical protein|nr:hypothetical protein [Thermoanaerobaculia bacterium]